MKRFLKWLIIICVSIVVLAVVGLFLITSYINPNRFKPYIQKTLKNYLHEDVQIKGDLSWRIFPDIGIKAHQVIIRDIEIADTVIDIRLEPLFDKQIDIIGFELRGVDIPRYHIRNAELVAMHIKSGKDFPGTIEFEYNKTKIKLNGKVTVTPDKDLLTLENVTGEAGSVSFDGNMTVNSLFHNPRMQSHWTFKPFNLKNTLQEFGQDIEILQSSRDAEGTVDIDFNGKISIRSQLNIEEIKIADLTLSKLNLNPHFENGILDISSVKANLYEGELLGRVKLNLNPNPIQLNMEGQVKNIQAETLLHDLMSPDAKLSLQGLGNINYNLATQGAEKAAILRNLNGNMQFDFVNGAVKGVDLTSLVRDAAKILNKKSPHAEYTDKTPFDSLKGTATIQNGIMLNNDLVIESTDFETKGEGKLDFPSEWINYVFYTTIKKTVQGAKSDWDNLFGVAIPIAVRGKLTDPSLSVDAGQLLKSIAVHKGEDQIQEKAVEMIQDLIKK